MGNPSVDFMPIKTNVAPDLNVRKMIIAEQFVDPARINL